MNYNQHQINETNNHICGWYIDKDFCNLTIEKIQKPQNRLLLKQWKDTKRNYSAILLSTLSKDLYDQYKTMISNLLSLYVGKFPYLVSMEARPHLEVERVPGMPELEIFQVQEYKPNKFYRDLHCENFGVTSNKNRSIAFMTYLNTITEGGGTDFPYQKFTSTAEQGLTLFWPAYWTHPHIGVVSPSKTKYIITGWIHCKDWA